MAQPIPTSLFFPSDGLGFRVGAITFDLLLDESHSMRNVVTSRPVQDSVEITDHIQNQLREGSLTGLISNFSITATIPAENEQALQDIKKQIDTGILSSYARQLFDASEIVIPTKDRSNMNRARDAYDALKAIWKSRQLVTIVTGLEVYENVAITEISADRDGTTGDAQEFSISFRQVRKVKLKTVAITTSTNPLAPKQATTNAKKNQSRQAQGTKSMGTTVGKVGEPFKPLTAPLVT